MQWHLIHWWFLKCFITNEIECHPGCLLNSKYGSTYYTQYWQGRKYEHSDLVSRNKEKNLPNWYSTLMSYRTPCWLQMLPELETRYLLFLLRKRKYAENNLQLNMLNFSTFSITNTRKCIRYLLSVNEIMISR